MIRFDLEQQMMAVWNILDDLEILLGLLEDDKQINILVGIIEIYRIKFDKMFDLFERHVNESANPYTKELINQVKLKELFTKMGEDYRKKLVDQLVDEAHGQ